MKKVIESSSCIDIEQNSLNEFQTSCIESMAFPILFPDCDGDSTNNYTIRSINGKGIETFASNFKHLIKFSENIDGK